MVNLKKYRYIRYGVFLTVTLMLGIIMSVIFIFTSESTEQNTQSDFALNDALSNRVDTSFVRITQPRPFSFPIDHGKHPDVKTEWWYMTGNITDSTGRDFGYQLTFFRSGLRNTLMTPLHTTHRSTWAVDEFFMGHFALSDIANTQFYAFEDFSRASANYARISLYPFHLHLGAWSLQSHHTTSFFPLALSARSPDGKHSITLTLDSLKPLVLQGIQGFSQKSADSGNASHYYSFPRIRTHGTVTINQQRYNVQGLSWFDREWSTSALARHQSGWDWFAIQFDNGYELMLYRLRSTMGQADQHSIATLIAPDGSTKSTRLTQNMLTMLSQMTVRSGTLYPQEWHIRIPELEIDCAVTPRHKEQELPLSIRYWEGAVSAQGTLRGISIRGKGYVEMTGYTDTSPSSKKL